MTEIHPQDRKRLSIFFVYIMICTTIIVSFLPIRYLAFIGLTFGLTDMTLTHLSIFGKNSDGKAVEINPIPALFMKYFKKYWIIPAILILISFFLSFYFFPTNLIYFIIGTQTMVIFNNYSEYLNSL